jgi:hypothetical protein
MKQSTVFLAIFVAIAVAAFGTVYTFSNQEVPLAEPLAYQAASPAGEVAGVTTQEQLVEVPVTITFADGSTQSQTPALAVGSSVLDYTLQTCLQAGLAIELEASEFGTLIKAIGQDTNGTNDQYWTYTVNGEFATVGAAEYQTSAGDRIDWTFSGF